MGMLGLASTREAGFVEKATMKLKTSLPAQTAYASLAKAYNSYVQNMSEEKILEGKTCSISQDTEDQAE